MSSCGATGRWTPNGNGGRKGAPMLVLGRDALESRASACDQTVVGQKQPMIGLLESCRKMPLALWVFAGFGWEFSSVRRMKPSVNVVEKQLLEPMVVA